MWAIIFNSCIQCISPQFISGGGIWGVLAAPIFNKDTGIFYPADEHSFRLFGWNLLGLLAINAWCVLPSFTFFFTLHLCKMLRVSEEMELKG